MFSSSFPVLKTDNILLRKIIRSDQFAVFQGLSDEQVIKYYGVEYHSYADTKLQLDWFNQQLRDKTGIWWGITTNEIGTLLGTCGLYNLQEAHQKAELGYWLMPAYWRQGMMRKALTAILKYGFQELNLHRIEAYVETENTASFNLLQCLGFRHEGTLEDNEIKKGRFISLHVLALLNK